MKRVGHNQLVTCSSHSNIEQSALFFYLRFVAGGCSITLRDAGAFVALRADDCAAHCAAEAHLEPLLIDRRGNCELLRHGAR